MVAGLFFTLPAFFLTWACFSRSVAAGLAPGVSNGNPVAYVIETGQRLVVLGND